MLSLMVTVLTFAAPAPLKLAMPGLRMTELPAERSGFYTEQLATELIAHGFRVVTEREISTLLGLDRQRELLGCSDESSSCLVELTSALGVDGLVLGDVAKIGSRYQVSLRVIRSSDGSSLAVHGFKAQDEEGVLDGLTKAAAALSVGVNRSLGREVAPPATTAVAKAATTAGPSRLWLVPAVGAVLALGAGAGCLVASRGDYARLDPAAPGRVGVAEAEATARRGGALQSASVALFAVGAAAGVGALGWWLLGSSTQVSATLSPSGGSISLAGELP